MNGVDAQAHPVAARFLKVMDWLNNVLLQLCGVAFALMVVGIFFTIIVRFIFSHLDIHIPSAWAEELSRYLLIWSVFVAGGIGTRTGELIGIDILMHAIPAPLGRFSKYLAHGLSLIFYALLVTIGWEWTQFGMIEQSPIMDIPMATVDAAMVVGGLLMFFNTVALILEARLSGKDIRHATGVEEELESLLTEFAQETDQGPAQ